MAGLAVAILRGQSMRQAALTGHLACRYSNVSTDVDPIATATTSIWENESRGTGAASLTDNTSVTLERMSLLERRDTSDRVAWA